MGGHSNKLFCPNTFDSNNTGEKIPVSKQLCASSQQANIHLLAVVLLIKHGVIPSDQLSDEL